MGPGWGEERRKGHHTLHGWSTERAQGSVVRRREILYSAWLQTGKYPAEDKPEGRETGLGRGCRGG